MCIREDNFGDMYSVIGDKEAQDEIRLATPKAQHCFLLARHSSGSCNELPYEVQGLYPGEVYLEGSVCPNNPYYAKKDLWESIDVYAPVLNLFESFRDVINVGGSPDLSDLTPEEFVVFKMVQDEIRSEDFMNRAEIMGGMFGGGKEEEG